MNLLQLAQQVWEETGKMGAGPTVVTGLAGDQARVVRRLRDCWLDLQRDRRWRWMRRTSTANLVAGQLQYTATDLGITSFWKWWPEGTSYTPLVLDADGNLLTRLHFVPYEEFRVAHLEQAASNGVPSDWSIAPNGDLLVGPPPSPGHQIKIDHFKALQELTDATDAPEMPADHHRLLVWMAAEQMGMSDENGSELARVKQRRSEDYSRLLTDQQDGGMSFDYAEPLL